MQLIPVSDSSLAHAPDEKADELEKEGYAVWKHSIDAHFVLKKAMRQTDDQEFADALDRLRGRATLSEADRDYWDKINLTSPNFTSTKDFSLKNSNCVWIHPTKAAVATTNEEYTATLDNVCLVRATKKNPDGRHQYMTAASRKNKSAKRAFGSIQKVDLISRIAIGMRVRLTVNIATIWGLANNCFGIIKEIVYPAGYVEGQEADVPVVVIDIPSYTGPTLAPFAIETASGSPPPPPPPPPPPSTCRTPRADFKVTRGPLPCPHAPLPASSPTHLHAPHTARRLQSDVGTT